MFVWTIPQPAPVTVMFSPTDNVGDAVDCQSTPVGTDVICQGAGYYCSTQGPTETFIILVPDGYELDNVYFYMSGGIYDRWVHWKEGDKDWVWNLVDISQDPEYEGPGYYIVESRDFTQYIFSEHNNIGDTNRRTYIIALNIKEKEE